MKNSENYVIAIALLALLTIVRNRLNVRVTTEGLPQQNQALRTQDQATPSQAAFIIITTAP